MLYLQVKTGGMIRGEMALFAIETKHESSAPFEARMAGHNTVRMEILGAVDT